jgi:hypothetical protein
MKNTGLGVLGVVADVFSRMSFPVAAEVAFDLRSVKWGMSKEDVSRRRKRASFYCDEGFF